MQTNRLFPFLLLFFCIHLCAFAYEHPGGMHPRKQIDFVREKIRQKQQPYYEAYLQLISYADSALLHPHHALSDFNVPGYYIEPKLHKANSKSLQSDAFDAYACALAYQLSSEEKYADKALGFLMAWAHTNTKYSNHDGSLVMAYSGTAMIMAAELMFHHENWDEKDKEKFFSWVKNVYRKASNEIRHRKNNWADWGRLGSILSAHLLDDTTEIAENIRLIKSDLFHKIAEDGHMPEEVRRERNGIWYTYFSLAPITAACWVALQAEGTNLFTWEEEGKSIKSALDYLFYYNQHPEEWKWFENPRPGSPDSWPGNLLEAMHGIYGDEKYSDYVAGARPLIYPTHHFAWTFPTLMKSSLPWSVSSQTTMSAGVPAGGDTDRGGGPLPWSVSSQTSMSALETLRERVISELMAPEINTTHIEHLINTIGEDGSWPDINYQDTSRTGFEHSRHLVNMVDLSRAYKKPGTQYHKKPEVKETVYASLDFWLIHDFICENWWWNQIGTPDRLVSVLLIMDEDLTAAQKEKAAPIAGRAHLDAWGARPGGDRIKIAAILGKSALFTRDAATLQKVVDTMAEEIRFAAERGTPSDKRGLQTGFSFHHRHDRVNNTLSYGLGYANAFAEWAAKVSGTQFKFPEEKIELLVDYYLDGICKMMVHGKYPDPGAKNRSITREGALHPAGPEIPEKLLETTDYRKEELQEIVKIRKGEIKPALTSNQFFWHSEYFSHQRPDYFTSVRMYSSRNHSMEEPYNEEGLKNHHLGEGSNLISRTGEEYTDIFPVWDWQKIPGTTVVQKPALPPEDEIQKKGLTDFVGGVSDGMYGAAAFDFKSPYDSLEARLEAKKAWFFFDKEYVSMGAGIHSGAPYPVVTTLNQCFLREGVVVKKAQRPDILKEGSHRLKKVDWIFHDQVAYIFPSPTTVYLENQEASGTWFSINRQSDSPKEEITHDVFKVWVDHGKKPENAQYAYMVVPGIRATEIEEYRENSSIHILANSPEIQAATHTDLGITQLVFYQAGEVQLTEGMRIAADNPGLVMVHTEGTSVKKISVADPSRQLAFMHLKLSVRIRSSGENFKTTWDEEKKQSEIIIDLPRGEYAGRSVVIEM